MNHGPTKTRSVVPVIVTTRLQARKGLGRKIKWQHTVLTFIPDGQDSPRTEIFTLKEIVSKEFYFFDGWKRCLDY